MRRDSQSAPARREFLTQVALAATAISGADLLAPARAGATPTVPRPEGPWDVSWVARLEHVPYKAVFDTNIIEGGIALDHAATFLDQFQEVYGTRAGQARAVLVMRQLGTPMAFNDAIWERYPVATNARLSDTTLRRNPFWRAAEDAPARTVATRLESLMQRGVIVVVCDIAATNWARSMAETTGQAPDAVKADVVGNLVPGAFLAPWGIFAMARAQNAGCAFMHAS